METFWRISNRCDLEGIGGEKADGRWHTAERGKRIVYLSEHPAVALVEVLANLHSDPSILPDAYQLVKVVAGEPASTETVHVDRLSEDWRDDLASTQSVGDQWLRNRTSCLLVVPSVPAPESFNYLFNPLHLDARTLRVEWCKWIKYDRRLFRTFKQ